MKAADGHSGRRTQRDVDGIILLDKPSGISSNRALQRVKVLFKARKAGHTGSLDPLATGMLPVCLGEATKVSGYLLESDKTYRTRLAFGLATATGDEEGATEARGAEDVSLADLAAVLRTFLGSSLQTPPMYSALKVGGQPLYRLARAGRQVDRAAREISIHDLAVEHYDPHCPVLRIRCSKGTYVRTLVEDIAQRLGTVAHIVELRRLSVSPFSEASMVRLERLEEAANMSGEALEAFLLPADQALAALPAIAMGATEVTRITQGQAVYPAGVAEPLAAGLVRLYGPDGRFWGVGERGADGRILPRRLVRLPPRDSDV